MIGIELSLTSFLRGPAWPLPRRARQVGLRICFSRASLWGRRPSHVSGRAKAEVDVQQLARNQSAGRPEEGSPLASQTLGSARLGSAAKQETG